MTDDRLYNETQTYLLNYGIIPFELIKYWIDFHILYSKPPLKPCDLTVSLLNKYYHNGFQSIINQLLLSYNDNQKPNNENKKIIGTFNIIDQQSYLSNPIIQKILDNI